MNVTFKPPKTALPREVCIRVSQADNFTDQFIPIKLVMKEDNNNVKLLAIREGDRAIDPTPNLGRHVSDCFARAVEEIYEVEVLLRREA